MIVKDQKLIFIHIPKTGGTSIESVFSFPESFDGKHRTAVDYISRIGRLNYHRYTKFTVVRNPWDRIVSLFEFKTTCMKDGRLKKYVNDKERKCFLDRDFKKWFFDVVSASASDSKRFLAKFGPNNQTYMLKNKREKISVENICRFENLDRDFRKFAKDKLNKDIGTLPHILKTKRSPYQEYYDDELRHAVEDFYSEDIENFGYSF
jgi:hypothetical protein